MFFLSGNVDSKVTAWSRSTGHLPEDVDRHIHMCRMIVVYKMGSWEIWRFTSTSEWHACLCMLSSPIQSLHQEHHFNLECDGTNRHFQSFGNQESTPCQLHQRQKARTFVSSAWQPYPNSFLHLSMLPPQVFDTVIAMDPFLLYTDNKQESTLYYPFDQWANFVLKFTWLLKYGRFSSFVSLLAINPGDNSTIPISGVIGYGTVVSWVALSTFYPTTVGQETKYSVALFVWHQAMIRAFVILLVTTNCKWPDVAWITD